jgi:hypothetical protein
VVLECPSVEGVTNAVRSGLGLAPRQLHESRAEGVAHLHQTGVFLDGRAILEVEKYGGTTGSTRCVNVGGRTPGHDQIPVAFKQPIPILDVTYRVAKVSVVTNSHVDGVHTALAHLPEDLLAPVAVLQGVDTNGWVLTHLVGYLCSMPGSSRRNLLRFRAFDLPIKWEKLEAASILVAICQ